MGCKYFLDTRSDPPALATLCTLYVSRTFHCWKEPEILPWLEKNVMAVLERIETGDTRVSESIQERSTRYQGLPRNIHRHIIMSDIKEALSHLPPELKEVASELNAKIWTTGTEKRELKSRDLMLKDK